MTRPHPLLIDLAADRPPRDRVPADPDALLASAADHRMTGRLWTAVSGGLVELPPAHAADLASRDLAAERHHRHLWATIDSIARRLADIGVEIAVAKGVVAEARWYDRLGERPGADIDVLLEPASRTRVADVLDALQPDHPLRAGAPRLVRAGILQSVDLTVRGVGVDLHADLFKIEIPTRQLATVWARTTTVTGPGGVVVRTLDAELSLVHLLLHLNKDRFARLIGHADVARLLAREDLDWAFLERFLHAEGLRVPVVSSLHAVADALDLPPPPLPRPTGVRAAAWQRLWPESIRLRGNEGLAVHQHRQLLIPLLMDGRAPEGARWLLRRRLFPPREMVPVYYPDTQGPYLVRVAVGRVLRARDRRREAQRFR